ncbi:Protein NUCLEAR FUSION DEFECTIVE [Trichinella spiralis]|uniref:Protein NUCLEAR FUSION DEFECTIVE n=1 Tax=Trichinella spiralis TaxID=6334 RepID=A0ABR3KCS9_TRISP
MLQNHHRRIRAIRFQYQMMHQKLTAAQQKSRHLTTVNVMKPCRTNNATTVKVCPQCQMPLVNVDNSKRFILIVLLMIITFPISLVYLCCMPPLKVKKCMTCKLVF